MKFGWIALLAALGAAPTSAAVVPAASAGAHTGHAVTVEGVVYAEVHTAHTGAETFIDLGGKYPNQTFVAVIPQRAMAAVGDVSGLVGKTVDLTGMVQPVGESKPGMMITARTQITVK